MRQVASKQGTSNRMGEKPLWVSLIRKKRPDDAGAMGASPYRHAWQGGSMFGVTDRAVQCAGCTLAS